MEWMPEQISGSFRVANHALYPSVCNPPPPHYTPHQLRGDGARFRANEAPRGRLSDPPTLQCTCPETSLVVAHDTVARAEGRCALGKVAGSRTGRDCATERRSHMSEGERLLPRACAPTGQRGGFTHRTTHADSMVRSRRFGGLQGTLAAASGANGARFQGPLGDRRVLRSKRWAVAAGVERRPGWSGCVHRRGLRVAGVRTLVRVALLVRLPGTCLKWVRDHHTLA